MPERSLLDLTVRELLDAVAARTSAPGGGAVAALATALAAALTGMAARFAVPDDIEPAAEAGRVSRPGATDAADGIARRPPPDLQALRDVAAEADELRARAAGLADDDAAAYVAFLAAVRRPRDEPGRDAAVGAARDRAADVPGEVAEIAAAVGALAADLVRHGNPNLRGDAVAAAQLASAAAATAAHLVADNLPPGDPRITRARDHAQARGGESARAPRISQPGPGPTMS